jgi:uncharacterized protein
MLLDEREGRKVAKSLGLKVTGILGILLRAKKLGEFESLQLVIDDLINKAGFRIAPEWRCCINGMRCEIKLY